MGAFQANGSLLLPAHLSERPQPICSGNEFNMYVRKMFLEPAGEIFHSVFFAGLMRSDNHGSLFSAGKQIAPVFGRFKFSRLDGDGRVVLLEPFDILAAAVPAVGQAL